MRYSKPTVTINRLYRIYSDQIKCDRRKTTMQNILWPCIIIGFGFLHHSSTIDLSMFNVCFKLPGVSCFNPLKTPSLQGSTSTKPREHPHSYFHRVNWLTSQLKSTSILNKNSCQPASASGIVTATASFTSPLSAQHQTGAGSAIAQRFIMADGDSMVIWWELINGV